MRKRVMGYGLGLLVVALVAWYAVPRLVPAKSTLSAASAPASAASGAGGAPVSISSAKVQQRNVDLMLEATGTVVPVNSVDVHAQAASTITKVMIREGQFVKAGDVLFTLDARADEVAVAKARAQVAKDAASLADAQRQLVRSKDLLAQGFISQGSVDTAQASVDSQQALVQADRAAVEAALVGLSNNRIVAPSAGRAGQINVYAGSTVSPTGAVLVTITQLDPITVAFSLPQRNLPDVLAALQRGGASVAAGLPGTGKTLSGKLDFVDNLVDPSSGTVRVKARFDNKQQQLWPGAFVTVQLAVKTLADAIVVPQAALIDGPSGKTVYVVDDKHQAQLRKVELLASQGLDAIVNGVKPGEVVVLDGRQNLRPGARVVDRAAEGGPARRAEAVASAASSSPASVAP